MTLYVLAGLAIAFAVVGLARALREPDVVRAQQYPLGSAERRSLEGGVHGT
ncbi:hypothetical protein [Rhodococcus sp. Eu-32]|uniref:hypothetical protein n=1 Tax=Rhodococcus sp. Eu-32 TaxID=1017319 RepID=UPI00140394C8|nr:hypothetical protein [Rhodococcus sp. Eu-32]